MQHTRVVRRGHTRAELPRDLQRLVGGRPAHASQRRGHVLAVDVLHGDEDVAVRLADVVDPRDVGMRDGSRDLDLVAEAQQFARVGGDTFGQQLQSHRLAQLQVVRAVDLAHAPTAEHADDAVSRSRAWCRVRSGRGPGWTDRSVPTTASVRDRRSWCRSARRRGLRNEDRSGCRSSALQNTADNWACEGSPIQERRTVRNRTPAQNPALRKPSRRWSVTPGNMACRSINSRRSSSSVPGQRLRNSSISRAASSGRPSCP